MYELEMDGRHHRGLRGGHVLHNCNIRREAGRCVNSCLRPASRAGTAPGALRLRRASGRRYPSGRGVGAEAVAPGGCRGAGCGCGGGCCGGRRLRGGGCGVADEAVAVGPRPVVADEAVARVADEVVVRVADEAVAAEAVARVAVAAGPLRARWLRRRRSRRRRLRRNPPSARISERLRPASRPVFSGIRATCGFQPYRSGRTLRRSTSA